MARSFSGDVRACRLLLVLLLRGRLTPTGIQRSHPLAARAGGTFRCLGGGGGFPHPGLRRLRFRRRGCRGRHRRGGADAGADADAGTPWPVPFPEPSSRGPTKPLGATKVPPSLTPSALLRAPIVFNPSGSCERSQPSPPGRVKSAASATSLSPADPLRRGLLLGILRALTVARSSWAPPASRDTRRLPRRRPGAPPLAPAASLR